MRHVKAGGGWPAVQYVWQQAARVGPWKLWKAMRSKNACKTCALGMGGQRGGMVNELGRFPEVCKKSVQAMVADMQPPIPDEFFRTHTIRDLQRMTPRELESLGRLTQPLRRAPGGDHYEPISWNEALAHVAQKLRTTPADQTFWYFSGRSSNEAGFLLQLFARLYGTNNVNNCSYYCHQASGVGLSSVVGSGTATIVLEDLEHADLVFVIGGNPASNHPRLMTSLVGVRRRGGEVIVINPVVEAGLERFRIPSDLRSMLLGSRVASLYVQPDVGGDLALLTGVAKRIVELGAADTQFLEQHCEGWQRLQNHLEQLDWAEIEACSGVSRSQIDDIATRYARARAAVFAWTMGITHHRHGVQNVQAIGNLALLRGMVGRPGAGLLPIRGHSNVQGMGTVGVTPALKQVVFDRLQERFGVRLPEQPGLDTMGCMEAAAAGRIRVGFCLGGNLFGSNPDARFAQDALQRLEQITYLNTTLNTGHAHGVAQETIILPVLARDEERQPTTQESMFNYVRLSDGGPPRCPDLYSEVEVIAELGNRVFADSTPIDWQAMARHGEIRQAIAAIIPGMEKLGEIDRSREEFQIGGRTFHRPQFPTPTGRARLHVHALPPLAGGGETLRLITVRSEGQFNTVVYEEHDLYRGQSRRDVVLVHPDDLQRLGIEVDAPVAIHSDCGTIEGFLARPFPRIKPGNALMYYPEANELVPRDVDPLSRTPAFKGVVVQLEPFTTGQSRQIAAVR